MSIKLTINRSSWARTTQSDILENRSRANSLYSSYTEKSCCMGFDCRNIKHVSLLTLRNGGLPSGIGEYHLHNVPLPFNGPYNLEGYLAMINDRQGRGIFSWVENIADKEQEEIIKRLYKLADYDVEFVD